MPNPQTTAWSLTDAKTRFSEVIDRAATNGPQIVTRHGHPVAVIVSIADWQRPHPGHRVGSLAEFFTSSPLAGSGVVNERLSDVPREIDL